MEDKGFDLGLYNPRLKKKKATQYKWCRGLIAAYTRCDLALRKRKFFLHLRTNQHISKVKVTNKAWAIYTGTSRLT